MTDIDGSFSLNLTTSNAILDISSIGYESVEVIVGNRTSFQIEMDEDLGLLDEVVVIGYGTMRKSDISGASVSVLKMLLKVQLLPTSTKHYKVEQLEFHR